MRDPRQPDADEFDWGEDFDDLDQKYWEDYFGGPDDDEIEQTY